MTHRGQSQQKGGVIEPAAPWSQDPPARTEKKVQRCAGQLCDKNRTRNGITGPQVSAIPEENNPKETKRRQNRGFPSL